MSEASEFDGKVAVLERTLDELGSAAIAFSGGVDSGVLLHVARVRLGSRAVGVIADSPSLPRSELARAREFAASIGARCEVLCTDELADPRYVENRGDRCYFCKSALFDALAPWARSNGYAALCLGEIVDDRFDERPGRRAARERGVHAPLAEAGFTKQDVRQWARLHRLSLADKAASACLASRLPVGTRVTRERLARVEAAEERLKELGFVVVRVRDLGERARVEVGPSEVARAQALGAELAQRLAGCGFGSFELAPYLTPLERLSAGRSAAS